MKIDFKLDHVVDKIPIDIYIPSKSIKINYIKF